jgi:hypothetical protein
MKLSKIQYTITPGFEALEGWIKSLPETFHNTGISIFKDRNEVKIFQESGYELNVKSFKVPNTVNRFVYVYLRGSKAARSFYHANKLIELGAATPGPVAFIECLSNGLLAESYYISLNYKTDFTLRDVLNNQVADKHNIIIQWVDFTWRYMHQNGVFHLDYSPGNTLIQKAGDAYNFSVVDLNRMKFLPVSFEKGIQNFRQLDADETILRLIAKKYAILCRKPEKKAFELLLKYDQSNKNFRRRKGNFKILLGKEP